MDGDHPAPLEVLSEDGAPDAHGVVVTRANRILSGCWRQRLRRSPGGRHQPQPVAATTETGRQDGALIPPGDRPTVGVRCLERREVTGRAAAVAHDARATRTVEVDGGAVR